MTRHRTIKLGDVDVTVSNRLANVLEHNDIGSLAELERTLKSGRFAQARSVGMGLIVEATNLVQVMSTAPAIP